MVVYADLHVHIGRANNGKPVKITASNILNFENIANECLNRKGIQLVGIIDCASPHVIADIEEFLEKEDAFELEKGGIIYKDSICILLGSEIETVEKRKDGKNGYAHNVCYFPFLEDIKKFSSIMSNHINNITLSTQKANISAYELLKIVKECNGILVPAHVFTPHKSFYGNVSNSLKDVFKEQFKDIKAIELGLSADSIMASHISELDDKIFLTNSDAHSLPKIAREYNKMELEDISFESFKKLINKTKDERGNVNNYIINNFGMDPKLGKYYKTYCENCEELSSFKDNLCIKCNSKKIVKGVSDRIEEIKDRSDNDKLTKLAKEKNDKYIYQVPLEFLPGFGKKTLAKMLDLFGTEMNILHNIEIDNIEAEFNERIALQIKNLREGKLKLVSGGGGIYGKVQSEK